MTTNQGVVKICDSGDICLNGLLNNDEVTSGVTRILLKSDNTLELTDLNNKIIRYTSNIPRLILVSSKDEDGCNNILDRLDNQLTDNEEVAFLHNIHKVDLPRDTCRGFTILETKDHQKTVSLSRGVKFCSGTARPVWFLYSGLGSQWAGAGKDLMQIPTFAAAIQKCHTVLEPKGIDIMDILTTPDKSVLDNSMNAMLFINAIQIGLTDVLRAMGIVPDYVIGISIGELGCAYADGCFTAEEVMLLSYWRGLVSINTKFIFGLVAAIGVGSKDLQSILPPEIDVGCHNSPNSCTIMGPYEIMEKFMNKVNDEGIFVKEVQCSNIPYHTKYYAKAGPGIYEAMKSLIKEPKLRSDRWISTSVPQYQWDQPYCKYASPEYFTNNLLNPVYFEGSAQLIPEGAIVIEVAPHGLMQAIMKRSHEKCLNVALNTRNCPRPVTFLFDAIGQLYLAGLNPRPDVLYPKDIPISTKPQFFSRMISLEQN